MAAANRRRFLSLALGAGASLGLSAAGFSSLRRGRPADERPQAEPPLVPVLRSSRALGTRVAITALHTSVPSAESAIAAAFAELDLVEAVLSLYRPHSQLCRLNRDGVLPDPHPYLLEVLGAARAMSERSGGAFDVTVQPLWTLCSAAHRSGYRPTDEEIAAVRDAIDWRRVQISTSRIELTGHGTAVTLNGIAQGFAADRACETLRRHGIEHALIDTGEISPVGMRSPGEPWTVGIQHPREAEAWVALAQLDGRCLATSGDYATAFSSDRRDNHVFDPRTGRSPDEFSSVSIVARTGMEADALSTAVFVLGLAEGAHLVETTPAADMLCVLKSGRVVRTAGFPAGV